MMDELLKELDAELDTPRCEVHIGTQDGPLCKHDAVTLCLSSCGHTSYYCQYHFNNVILITSMNDNVHYQCPLHDDVTEVTLAWSPIHEPTA